ncbi:hypothetical protein GIB67_031928 [Kingdonia uniflora]|uniref:Uncharacterized protein n=1 Tax=Kingdonia uniflora TaxID=39325 RepID=A0A7J7NTZ7_9MAGN|nr:hypothetical protein GIB67_031928 [Kingdonia uniflora]
MHIDKLERQYGQYRIEGTKKGDGNTGQGITCQYVAIAPQPPYFLPPPLVRGTERPRNERIHDPYEKGLKKMWLDTNTNRDNFMINIGLPVDAGGGKAIGRTGSGGRTEGGDRGRGRTGRNIVGGRTGTRGGGDRGKTRGGEKTGRNILGGRTEGDNIGGRTGISGSGDRGRARGGARGGARGRARGRVKQTFQAPRQSEGVTQVSTS